MCCIQLRSLKAALLSCSAMILLTANAALAQNQNEAEQQQPSDRGQQTNNQDNQFDQQPQYDQQQPDPNRQRDQEARDRENQQPGDRQQNRDRQDQAQPDRQYDDQDRQYQPQYREDQPGERQQRGYERERRDSEEGGLGVSITQDRGPGLVVVRVHPGSPAQEMGLQEGDRITRFNGEQVSTVRQFISRIRDMQPGDRIEIQADRNRVERRFVSRLESREQALADRGEFRDRQSGQDWRMGYRGGPPRGDEYLVRQVDSLERQLQRLTEEVRQLRFAVDGRIRQTQRSRDYDSERWDGNRRNRRSPPFSGDSRGREQDSQRTGRGEYDRFESDQSRQQYQQYDEMQDERRQDERRREAERSQRAGEENRRNQQQELDLP